MTSADAENFRLAVLNPGGRDHEQHFTENRAPQANEHPPVNFHAYAACTHGAVFRDTKRAIASNWPVLLLLRGDFRASERTFQLLVQVAGLFYGFVFMAVRAFRYRGSHR